MELKGSKTEQNLWAAFAGESQAHTKYQYFASQAKKDGFVQIHNIFTDTAKNEKEHAKIWFKLVNGGRFHQHLIILRQPLPASMRNGPPCILNLPR